MIWVWRDLREGLRNDLTQVRVLFGCDTCKSITQMMSKGHKDTADAITDADDVDLIGDDWGRMRLSAGPLTPLFP